MGDNGQCTPATVSTTSKLAPPPPSSGDLAGHNLGTAARPPSPPLAYLRSLTSASTLSPAPAVRQAVARAIKEPPGKLRGTWRAISRNGRRPLRRSALVAQEVARLLPLPNVANAPATVTPRGSSAATRGAHRRRLWMSLSRYGAGRRAAGPRCGAGDRPPERDRGGARWCRPRLGGAPATADKQNVRSGGVKTPRGPPTPEATSNRRCSRSRHRPPALTLEPAPPLRVLSLLGRPPPPHPHRLASRCLEEARNPHPPSRRVRGPGQCFTAAPRAGTASTASSLTLPPGGYRTWFQGPIQTPARRLRTDKAHGGAARRGRHAGRCPGVD